MTISVLVADDHPTFRDGLTAMLNAQADIHVVAGVGTGSAAISTATELQPDVAIVDLRMPDGDGISATIGIRRAAPDTRVLVLTTFDGSNEVTAALAAGAHGYLIKSAAPDEIAQAVRAIATGSAVLDDGVLTRLAKGSVSRGEQLFPELTERETAVLSALARGLSTESAGAALGLTPKTVRNYLASITAKLGVRDRTAAVVLARDRGLYPPPADT